MKSANDDMPMHKKIAMGEAVDNGQVGARSLPRARCDCDPAERGYGKTIDAYEGTGGRQAKGAPEGGRFSKY